MMLPASQILVPLLLQDFDINWKPSSPPSKRARLREFKHFIPHDGHEWLKYGQKDISGGRYSRHYFRCSHSDNGRRCPARRVVDVHTQFGQPGASDLAPRVTYSGKHNHAQPASRTPSENESLLANPIFPTERAKLAASVREQQQAIAGHMFPLPRAQLQQLPGSEKRQQHATTLDLSLIRSGLAKEDGERCDNESCPLTPTTPTSLKPLSLPLSAPLSPQLSPPPSTPVSLWTPVSLRPVSSSSVILPSPRAAAEEAEREAGELQTGLVKGKRKRPMLAETGADDTSRADAEGCQGSEISLTLDHGVLLLPGKDLETSPVTLSDPLGHGLLQAVTDRANASNMFDTCDLGPLQADPTEACPNGAAAALPKSGSVTRLSLQNVEALASLIPPANDLRPSDLTMDQVAQDQQCCSCCCFSPCLLSRELPALTAPSMRSAAGGFVSANDSCDLISSALANHGGGVVAPSAVGETLVIVADETGVIQVVTSDGIQERQGKQADNIPMNELDRRVPELSDSPFWTGIDASVRDMEGRTADAIRELAGLDVFDDERRCDALVILEDSLGMLQVGRCLR